MRTVFGFLAYIVSPYLWTATAAIDRWITWGFGATSAERRRNACMLLGIWLLLCALGALMGCSLVVPNYAQVKALADQGIDTAIEDRKDANDKKAEVIRAINGEITHGAYLRKFNDAEKCAIDTLILGSVPAWCNQSNRLAAVLERLAPQPASPQPGAEFPPSSASPELGP